MKKMTCLQLGGACDKVFTANTFEEMAALSKQHGIEMFQAGDQAHLTAMGEMKKMMETPGAVKEWFDAKRKEFDALPVENE